MERLVAFEQHFDRAQVSIRLTADEDCVAAGDALRPFRPVAQDAERRCFLLHAAGITEDQVTCNAPKHLEVPTGIEKSDVVLAAEQPTHLACHGGLG